MRHDDDRPGRGGKVRVRRDRVVLLLAGALVAGCTVGRHHGSMPANPTASPTGTPDVNPDDPMLKVNWFTATITGVLSTCGFGTNERALTCRVRFPGACAPSTVAWSPFRCA
jgi:hypothetical protein